MKYNLTSLNLLMINCDRKWENFHRHHDSFFLFIQQGKKGGKFQILRVKTWLFKGT
jgi:hypothetical protein